MNDDKPVPQNDPVAPYRQMYYMLEQLRDENAAHIRERQELQDKLQRSLAILPPFIKELGANPPIHSISSGTVYNTGIMLLNEFQRYGGSITAGTASVSLTNSISGFVHEGFQLGANPFPESTSTLTSLSLPVRSNIQALSELIKSKWPNLLELTNSIPEALQQTTDPRRYEHGGTKLRELVSQAGLQVTPDQGGPYPDWLERTDKGKLTQASRWLFGFFRHLDAIVYPTDLREKCERLATSLRADYQELNGLTHNRSGEAITANEAEPLINRTVIHLQEVFSLLEETAMNRHAMIHAELRQALSSHLELSPHVADFFKLNHEFALNPSCGPEETISATYVTSDGDFIVTAIASFQKRATLTIQHIHKFLPPEDGSHS